MEFCPWCGLLLQIGPAQSGRPTCLSCPVCPYYCVPLAPIKKETKIERKPIEPIIITSEEMKNAPKTKVTCPKCHHGEAYYRSMQIRSADEPETIIYTCCNDDCRNAWREG